MGGIPEKLLTLEEAARRLQCPVEEMEQFIQSGRLPVFRLGGSLVRVRLQDIETLRSGTVTRGNAPPVHPKPFDPVRPEPFDSAGPPHSLPIVLSLSKDEGERPAQDRPVEGRTSLRTSSPVEGRTVRRDSVRASTVLSANGVRSTLWERLADFIYFNDFYLVVLLIILTFLALIFTL